MTLLEAVNEFGIDASESATPRKKLWALMQEMQKRAEIEERQYLLFIDEMLANFFEESVESTYQYLLQLSKDFNKVQLYMAVRPMGQNLTTTDIKLRPKSEQDEKVIMYQLQTRHRNSYLISAFLLHLTEAYNTIDSPINFKCCSYSEDDKLIPYEKVEKLKVTRWFHFDNGTSEAKVLETLIDMEIVKKNSQALISPIIVSEEMKKCCSDNGLELVTNKNMTGSEREEVVAFVGANFGNLEIFSRAKTSLIIVTIKGEGTSVGDSVLLERIRYKVHKKNSCKICQRYDIKVDEVLYRREISTS